MIHSDCRVAVKAVEVINSELIAAGSGINAILAVERTDVREVVKVRLDAPEVVFKTLDDAVINPHMPPAPVLNAVTVFGVLTTQR